MPIVPLPQNRIAQLRGASGLSRQDVATRLGVSERTVYRWETGESSVPDVTKLELAGMFGVSVAWLLGWESDGDGGDGGSELRAA
jgi:transcriptional regulator with XRE-family HTH domain